ncbi:choice-of-anchor D domain-containing protein [Acidicapsa acidisoli]|uniref:choice-of-anchor D domain-containing protein n=1 Tax=Acidicapsa acidisoli TaxID=1615681 RepID=UPI0021DF58B4|nr:choice-of-anchor D domain-containing protein [Acidicapsa acidisoli]
MANKFAVSAANVRPAPPSVSSTNSSERGLCSLPVSLHSVVAGVRRALSLALTMMLLGASCTLAQGQTLSPAWVQQSPAANPGGRFESSITYDAAHGQVVLFSGDTEPSDTWLWNGYNWTEASTTGPSPRYNPAMVYDAAHGQVVLFGGTDYNSGIRQGDTWVWNGSSWTEVSTTGPTGRNGAVMVYDATHNDVVLFGGIDDETGFQQDTWIWNGTSWAKVSTTGPSPRADYSMAYDSTMGQVVLFGGDGSAGYLNDTWVWDGTAWTQLNPANSPSAREAQGMAYNAALGQVILFGGTNGSYLDDSWVWNGTNWTEVATPGSLTARIAPNGMTYDAALGQVILYSGLAQDADTWEWGLPGNFGNVNVCPSGQTIPAPCSSTLEFTYNVAANTTFGTPQVVTQGATGLDFSLATGNTCINTVSAGGSCTVSVTFTPLAPGLRTGAVKLVDAGGNLLTTTLVYGTGQGPAVGFGPGIQTTVSSGWNQTEGVAVDAAGDVFVSNYGLGQVSKVAPGGVQSTVPASGLLNPYGVAVDGAGDVFVADPNNHRVVKVTPSGVQTTVGSVSYPYGVAVDGAGDVFIVDSQNTQVVEVTPNGVQTTVPATGLTNPYDVAVDGAGDVFISDPTNVQVVKVAPGGVQTTVPANGLVCPYGVAVDAAGDVFIADPCLGEVVEVAPSGVQTTTASSLVGPISVAVDGTGNVYIGNNSVAGVVTKVNRSQVPSLSFSSTSVGYTSSDSPQSVALQNIGNQTLSAESPGLLTVNGPNFVNVPGSGTLADCSASSALTPGQSCNLSISFEPQAGGSLTSTAVFTDNALNANSITQSIGLSGFGVSNVTLTVTGSGTGSGFVQSNPTGINCNEIAGVTSGTCSASVLGGVAMSLEEVPTAGSTFTGWTGVCAGQGQICVLTLNTATSVSATFVAAINFPLTVTEIGNGTGTVTDNLEQIDCSQANGVSTGTCAGSYSSGTQVTLTAAASGSSTFLGWGGVCASAGTSPTCSLPIGQAVNVTASFVNQSFGGVNVCPSGQTTPAPCSATMPVTINLAANTTIGAIQVVTQGVTGLDFNLGSGNTCTGAIVAGNSCSVNVAFTPLAPGLRMGAVNLYDNGGDLVAAAPVYGIGQGPAVAFGPATQAVVNLGSVTLNQAKGLTIDAAGDAFIADTLNQRVVKISANGTLSTVGTGLEYPQGLAVDGAGDLFIGDNLLNEVVEVPAGCISSTCQKTIGTGLRSQLGVAVDGRGNVFIGDFVDGEVAEVPANGGAQTVVYSPGNGSNPVGLAVDSAGNLYVADFGLKAVKKVPAGCTTSTCTIALGGGWQQPDSVSVDAAGDVFVADFGLQEVIEIPAGCTTGACAIVVASGIQTVAAAVDWVGDVFIPNEGNNQLVELTRSQPASLSFALTNVGSTSGDSPQQVTVQNIGNQQLSGSIALSLGANFAQSINSTCGSSFSLAPGAICSEIFSFTPQSTGYFTASASLFDNTFNLSPLVTLQTINLSGNGGLNGQAVGATVPNVVGQTEAAASTTLTTAGLTLGTVSTAYSSSEPAGSVVGESPAAGSQVNLGTTVALLISTGQAPTPTPNPLTFENNYFVTGDYASAGVTLRGTGVNGIATGTITIPDNTTGPGVGQGVPDGADIVDGFLYWETLENTATPSANTGTFLGYPITGQQIGSDVPYTDRTLSGTLRVYRADINTYFPASTNGNGVRYASGAFKVSLPDSGGSGFPLTEGASLVVIYRVLSPNFPLKSVVIYDGSATPTTSTTQAVQGFYDALGTASGTESTILNYTGGAWNNSLSAITLAPHASQYSATLNAGTAYAAVILSTPVTNSDNDGILDAWKSGPGVGSFFAGQSGYTDVKTQSWVALPGAKHGRKDLFVQLDYMCGAVLASGACDPNQENLFPSPDPSGNDPLAMVQQAFASAGIVLHLTVGNAVPESTCTDSSSQLCQFPNQPGVIGWKNSLEFSKVWPRNLASCAAGTDCTARFPYGQKDSYHYVLFGHSLAVPAWSTRYQNLTSINVVSGVTTIFTADRGSATGSCPSRITLSGVLGNPALNGVYNTTGCPDTKTIILATPGVPNWSYPNTTLPEPVIGLTSGTITSISGYSDLGGADSAVTLALWETNPNQDMSKRANVIAGTLYHEIGHTLGLSHGGLYYDAPGSYVPTFEVNCKPNYQSVMNYLFQLDGVGPNAAVAYSNQTLTELFRSSLQSVGQLADTDSGFAGIAPTFSTSVWYTSTPPTSTTSPATLHCDGTPLTGDTGYRVNGTVAPISPPWQSGQNVTFDGASYSQLRGYNDVAKTDLRQVGATGGEFASLANVLSFGSSSSPLSISAGGNVTLGSGGTVTLGSGGNVTLGSGGNVTLGSGGTITLGSGGSVTFGSNSNVTLGSGATVTPGNGGTVTLGSGGNVTLGSGGTITLGSGGNVTLGSGGNVTLGSGGTITLGSGGSVTIPATGGSYTIGSSGGTITLGSGGNVTLGSGGNVTLGSGGTIALGSGGNVTLGSGGNVTLGSGGTVTLGSGGNITLGSGGNVTLGSGGTIALGSGGVVVLGSGGNVTLGSGGTVTLGSGGDTSESSGGNVTLGSGGTATLGAGGTVTLGSGGNVTLGSGGNVTLGSGGTITLGSGGNITLGSGGTITLGSGGTVTPTGGSAITIGAGGSYTFGSSGGTITLGSGGNVTLGSGGNVTLGSGGTIALGSGGVVTLGSGGNVTLGSGGVVTLGSGGNVTLGSGGTVALGSGGNITLGSGGAVTNELTYETANSVVRPPSSPTETPTSQGVRVDWTAPAFGVVSTYTIYRSSDGATPILIGSVSGVNGAAPATEFIDTNPDLTSQTVVYTISTTLVPDSNGTQRQSPPSAPAVLKNDQSITLGPLPSSVVITNPPTITATAMSSGAPNGLQVNFSASGSCSIGSQSIANNVSSAAMVLNTTGSCAITASQAGTNSFNAANSVSGTFQVLPQGSTTQSQTINFALLPNVVFGNSFTLSASSSVANNPVIFTSTGPCSTNGKISGAGVCTITASAAAIGNYSAASQTQSFTIYPAVIEVIANNLNGTFGQPLPPLTFRYIGFVNGDTASVVSGAPALSTTATATSNAGSYPIAVSTGTLAAANYSFLYVNGKLTIQPANQSALTLITASPLTYNQSETLSVTGGSTGGAVTYSATGSCTISGAKLTANSGTGACLVTATMAGNTNYNAVTSTPANTITLAPAGQTITFTTNPPASAAYNGTFTVAATGGGSGNAVTFTSSGACSNTGVTYKMTSSTGTCSVIASQAGNSNYGAAQTTKTVNATGPSVNISPSNINFGTLYLGSISTKTITVTNTGTAPVTVNDPLLSIVHGGNSNEYLAVNLCLTPLAAGKSCTVTIAFIAGPFYTPQTATLNIMDNAPGSPQQVALSAAVVDPLVSFSPTSLNFGTIKHATSSTLSVTVSNPGATPLVFSGAGISVTGTNASDFVQTNTCGSSLASGAKCSVSVKFTPPATGTFSANLTLIDNAQSGSGTQTIPLSGKGN